MSGISGILSLTLCMRRRVAASGACRCIRRFPSAGSGIGLPGYGFRLISLGLLGWRWCLCFVLGGCNLSDLAGSAVIVRVCWLDLMLGCRFCAMRSRVLVESFRNLEL